MNSEWIWAVTKNNNNNIHEFEWSTGADWGGRSKLKGKVDLVLKGVFTNWGCLVILPGTSNPFLLLEGVGTVACLSSFFTNGLMGLLYLL